MWKNCKVKTLLVISDTHNLLFEYPRIFDIMDECDYIIHLGDGSGDISALIKSYRGKVVYVRGNNDNCGEREKIFTAEGVDILLTHGDAYSVKYTYSGLVERALETGVKYVMYGHTHEADIHSENGITLINPGSLGFGGTYCYCVVTGGKLLARKVNL